MVDTISFSTILSAEEARSRADVTAQRILTDVTALGDGATTVADAGIETETPSLSAPSSASDPAAFRPSLAVEANSPIPQTASIAPGLIADLANLPPSSGQISEADIEALPDFDPLQAGTLLDDII